ncbi:hypothetical protein D1007_62406 [Hordeum vulgare]|nr:hypothetical protein D1007_62406 [Hordeum vulgare]
MQDNKWMKGLERISSHDDLHSFLLLWEKIQNVNLSESRDTIDWIWTKNKTYSTKSAYSCQFIGSVAKPEANNIWRLKIERKVQFFIWTLAQNKLPTINRLRAHESDHTAMCSLCRQLPETALHLFSACSSSMEVRNRLHLARPLSYPTLPANPQSISQWWRNYSQNSREIAVAAAYFAWHIWNERNRRIFNTISIAADGVTSLIKADLDVVRLAM